MNEPLTISELLKLWRVFCGHMVENPHHVDSDFSFDNFMSWLEQKEEQSL